MLDRKIIYTVFTIINLTAAVGFYEQAKVTGNDLYGTLGTFALVLALITLGLTANEETRK